MIKLKEGLLWVQQIHYFYSWSAIIHGGKTLDSFGILSIQFWAWDEWLSAILGILPCLICTRNYQEQQNTWNHFPCVKVPSNTPIWCCKQCISIHVLFVEPCSLTSYESITTHFSRWQVKDMARGWQAMTFLFWTQRSPFWCWNPYTTTSLFPMGSKSTRYPDHNDASFFSLLQGNFTQHFN